MTNPARTEESPDQSLECAEGPSTVESLGLQLRSAIELLRVNSVSVYDSTGSVLWLSEGVLGPDEHAMVQVALDALSRGQSKDIWERMLEDNRDAVIAPLRSRERGLTGVVLVLTEIHYDSGTVNKCMYSSAVSEILARLAGLMPAPGIDPHEAGAPLASRPSLPAAAPSHDTDLTRVLPRLAPTATSGDARGLPLYVQPIIKLHSGGQTHRFDVLPRGTPRQNRDPGSLDMLALERLLEWLDGTRQAWAHERVTFSLALSLISLGNHAFCQQLLRRLAEHRIPPAAIGFGIAEPLCLQAMPIVEPFIAECDKIGCSVTIGGFTFDTTVRPLLRHSSVQLLKVHPKLTTAIMHDRLSQAVVIAIVNAAKVMGIHCAVENVESRAALRWLKDVGYDFAQDDSTARAVPIDALRQPAREREALADSA